MSEYPKTLYHPAYSAGVPAKPLNAVQLAAGEAQEAGIPCRYAPVTVKTAKDEEYHRAMGYMAQQESHVFAQYSDYPKMMIHPGHVDAVPDAIDMKKDDEGNLVRIVIPGKPEMHPHVFVNDAEQEEAWRAKGYDLPGKADPVTAADLRVEHVEGYQPVKYPAMIGGRVINPDAHKGGPDEYPKFVEGQIVYSRDEEEALTAQPGELTPAKIERKISERLTASIKGDDAEVERIETELLAQGIALKDKPHGTVWSRVETGEATLSEGAKLPADDPRSYLIAEAKARGIRVHHKWSIEKLQEALKAA